MVFDLFYTTPYCAKLYPNCFAPKVTLIQFLVGVKVAFGLISCLAKFKTSISFWCTSIDKTLFTTAPSAVIKPNKYALWGVSIFSN